MAQIELLEINSVIPDVILDIRYSTENNCTGQKLYKSTAAYLKRDALDALKTVADKFINENLRLIIYDAYRPIPVHEKLKFACDNTDYVAEISNHCRGITVDLSLANLDGSLIDMGTDFDEFIEASHPGSDKITSDQTANREMLAAEMTKAGFVQHPNEWWHFDYMPGQKWPLIEGDPLSLAL